MAVTSPLIPPPMYPSILARSGRFHEAYLAGMPPDGHLEYWGSYPARAARYAVFWSHFCGNVYRDIHRQAETYKAQYGLHAPVMAGDASAYPGIRPFRVLGGTWANEIEFEVESTYSTAIVPARPRREITFAPQSVPTYPARKPRSEVRCVVGGAGRPNRDPFAATAVAYIRPVDGLTYRLYCAEQAVDPAVWGEGAPEGAAGVGWAEGLVAITGGLATGDDTNRPI